MTAAATNPIANCDVGFATPEARWARLGPYYAMFPFSFAQGAIDRFTLPGDLVLDPFCGRGTAPYAAMIAGRDALACEINPVAWVYAATKTAPATDPDMVKVRIGEIAESTSPEDREPRSEFQALAFCRTVLGFLHAARRELRWRHDTTDRTVAALMLHYLHSKIPQGLSNQMRHCRSMSPRYCVRWWNENGYGTPPEVDPVGFLNTRVDWRYRKGIPERSHNSGVAVSLGDSATNLKSADQLARLVVTSPPYSGVTDYKADSWLRLWAIGEGPPLPKWDSKQKYVDLADYRTMLRQVLSVTAKRAHPDAAWLVRCDARERTFDVVLPILAEIAGDRDVNVSPAPFRRPTQTSLYGDRATKPGEMDLLVLPRAMQDQAAARSDY
ncbi:MAG: site-specific DNA-methyltransferase [Acidimicrobiia bacterium]|nr:site-specific DNA-methyltransferase [Acidimicrobiia bacterium]MYG58819.1 site-specific DNA-methyltransferase [Acidimicrobiia bacterium]MYJ33543.1 site-specific DNA-methyltransferase [Acidimicrobiia bacterium]